jgi:hypothetical protein
MSEDTVVRFQNPGSVRNALTELRQGAGTAAQASGAGGIAVIASNRTKLSQNLSLYPPARSRDTCPGRALL